MENEPKIKNRNNFKKKRKRRGGTVGENVKRTPKAVARIRREEKKVKVEDNPSRSLIRAA